MGGGKGGADFDPKGKSDNEIRRFCVAFMSELGKHIGANTDIPAGDIGVSPREIGWLFGQYKKQTKLWEGVLTGKALNWGGSLIRPEATGYGLVYVRPLSVLSFERPRLILVPIQYVQHMISKASSGAESFAGKRVIVSGSGNVAQYAALKVIELGGTVLSLSDSVGALISSKEGITPDQISLVASLKVRRKQLSEIASTDDFKDSTRYVDGARPWTHVGRADVALPCATQNEVSGDEARALVEAGVKFVAEGSNMGCSQDAIDVFEANRREHVTASGSDNGIWYAPGKAANAGGVAVSGLEMAQNSQRISWTKEEVDGKLKGIMEACFLNGVKTAEEYVTDKEGGGKGKGGLPSLVAGSNIAGFVKVADAMRDQGDWW